MDISKIDKNFDLPKIEGMELDWYDIEEAPFKIYGVKREGEQFVRMDQATAKATSEGVFGLSQHTAGGRVRFRSDAPGVALAAKQGGFMIFPHMTICGTTGFDLYVNGNFNGTYMPDYQTHKTQGHVGNDQFFWFKKGEMNDMMVEFPLYNDVQKVMIGLPKGSRVETPKPYTIEKPFVFYGSSITQGGCASRPGTCYQSHISRHFDADYINLGFSGSGRGETVIADYMANLDMSLFVLDYDHNAPNAEWLKNTHEPLFLKIREKHPDVPVLMVSHPAYDPYWLQGRERYAIIEQTYNNALARGDKHVAIIDGSTFFEAPFAGDCMVDNVHPTDLGFYFMAKKMIPAIEKLLKEA